MPELDDETIEINGRKVTVDEYIKVLKTAGNKTSFIGRVKGWWIKDGEVVAIDVWGGSGKKIAPKMRSLRLDQVEILSPRTQNKKKRTL